MLAGSFEKLHAQSINIDLVDSGGVISSVTDAQILYTIGEANIQEVSAGIFQLSEGFIHSYSYPTLSINEIGENKFLLHPNPVAEKLFIEGNLPTEQIRVYDINGRLMFESTDNLQYLNMAELSTGIYFVQIKSDNKWEVERIVKN